MQVWSEMVKTSVLLSAFHVPGPDWLGLLVGINIKTSIEAI